MKGGGRQVEIPLNEMDKDMEARKRSSLGPHRRKHVGEWHKRRLEGMRGTRTRVRAEVYNRIIV